MKIVALLFAFCIAASAARLVKNNSDYGTGTPANYNCFDILAGGNLTIVSSGSSLGAVLPCADVLEQDFLAPTNGNYAFDYQVRDLVDFTLTINSASPSMPFIDYGEFACQSGAVLCTNGLSPNGLTVTSASSVSFSITGNDLSNPDVLYVACAPDSCSGNSGVPTVTVAATPEPRVLPVIGFGLMVVLVSRRRRKALP